MYSHFVRSRQDDDFDYTNAMLMMEEQLWIMTGEKKRHDAVVISSLHDNRKTLVGVANETRFVSELAAVQGVQREL